MRAFTRSCSRQRLRVNLLPPVPSKRQLRAVILDWFVRHKRFGKFRSVLHREVLAVRPLRTFPRIIHLYWDQGFDQAPELVRACVQSWEERNLGWVVRSWDRASADAVVSFAKLPAGIKVTPYSDILRTELLRRHGGVWADATVYCTRPLDDWLLQIMAQTDFFAFSRPGPDREIASWFLASRPEGLVVSALARGVERFWRRQKAPTRVYHWFQYVFEYLDRVSRRFSREWRTAPRISAAPLLMLQGQLAGGAAPSADLELCRALPMQKLTHKRPLDVGKLKALLG